METETEDEQSAGHPTLASSWDAACGALDRSLRVRGAQDSDREELPAPPAPGCAGPAGTGGGSVAATLRGEPGPGDPEKEPEEPGGTALLPLPELRPERSEHENIILYKKFLKLESAAQACKVKLLSFGEKPCVFVSEVVVHVRPVPAKSPSSCPALGPRVDLERVHTMVAAMGSTLSPGAQQLMSMVRSQQQRCVPLGEQLQAVLGSAACKRVLGLRASAPSGACGRPTSAPAPLRAGLTSGRSTEDVKAPGGESARPPGGGNPAALREWDIAPQNHPLPGRDLQLLASFLPKRASDSPGAPAPELLPILQDVCGQVRRLRGAPSAAWPGHSPTASEGGVGAGMGEPPACSYLEKVLSKKLELMERRLTDYLDERLRALQEHIDGKVALLARSLHSPGSPPPGMPLTHCDSGDGLSNGER